MRWLMCVIVAGVLCNVGCQPERTAVLPTGAEAQRIAEATPQPMMKVNAPRGTVAGKR